MRLTSALVFTLAASAALAQSPDASLPGGAGCQSEIARYRAVQDSDVASGNVARSVYAQVKREIEAAEKVCAAGQDAKAMALVRASQVRHGYPTHG